MAKRDNHLAARVLADWARHRFARAEAAVIAATYGVGLRTVWRWKSALDDDAELAALYKTAVATHLRGDWAEQLDDALRATIDRLLELVGSETDLSKVTEAFAKLSDVALEKEMLRGALEGDAATRTATVDGTNHRQPARAQPN